MKKPSFERGTTLHRLLTFVLGVGLVLAIGGVGYISMSPSPAADPFTEFYILGPDGKAANYPTNLTVGESGRFIVGITNHERSETRYTVVLQLDGERIETMEATLEDEKTWEKPVSFTPSETGELKLRILLYKGDAGPPSEPHQSLRLWITVSVQDE